METIQTFEIGMCFDGFNIKKDKHAKQQERIDDPVQITTINNSNKADGIIPKDRVGNRNEYDLKDTKKGIELFEDIIDMDENNISLNIDNDTK